MGRLIATPPIIDISPLQLHPHSPAATTAAAAMHTACLDTGFFVIVKHGLDAEITSLFDAARAFFSGSQESKERTPRADRYGYIPYRATAIDQSRASDNTESLDLGLGDEVELPAVAGFESAVRSYQPAAIAVAATILRALATALDTPPDYFAARMTSPQCRLRLLHYPEVEPGHDGSLPVPNTPHTDYGLITLLATDGVPGLEVKPIDSDWTPVTAPPGSLVVNLGDMLARWTNDIYRSTPHRVVGPAFGDRVSIPFFINPNPDTIIDCLPSCVSGEHRPRYESVTAAEFLASRIDGTTEPYIDPDDGPTRRAGS
jgi:isopenicillin N synthase-like dioxygenase